MTFDSNRSAALNTHGVTLEPAPAHSEWRRQPIVFGKRGAQLFGFHYAPEGEVARGSAIVLCNSFGYEVMYLHRTYRELAERLAGRGFHVLRFDYYGTGDSAGQDDEPERIRSFLDSIGVAVEEIKKRAGVSRVTLFGLRLGGTLAFVSASERSDIEAVIAWNASLTGRAYLREQRALQLAKASDELLFKDTPDGDLEVGGYLLTTEACDELNAIDLSKFSGKTLKRALLLARDDIPTNDSRLQKALRAAGVEVESCVPAGYAEMARDAEYTKVPSAALDAIDAWLCRAYPAETARPPVSGIADALLEATTPAGATVSEHPFTFGENDQLFGIVSAPSRSTDCSKVAVLFANVGANHHVGSSRLYVTLSRALAARGIVAMRFDIAGVGDSPARANVIGHPIYALESVADVRAAMSSLTRAYGVQKFVLAGICSGAYLAFHTTAADPRVAAQILINAQTFEWHPGDSLEVRQRRFKSLHFYRYALLHPGTWARVWNGKVNIRGIARYLLGRAWARAKISVTSRVFEKTHPANVIERTFVEISERGTESLLIYSASDAGVELIANYLGPGARKMQKRKNFRRNFRMEIIVGADHTFTPRWSQTELTRRILDFVTGLNCP